MESRSIRAIVTSAMIVLAVANPGPLVAAPGENGGHQPNAKLVDAMSAVRIHGPNRYATAAAFARYFYEPVSHGGDVVVASGENFPDALAGAAVAGKLSAPMLLVRAGSIPTETGSLLDQLNPARIVVMGGSSSVSDGVRAGLAGYTRSGGQDSVLRIGGMDRFGTAAIAAQRFFPTAEVVFLATGHDFPDALTGAAAAAGSGAPLLLVSRDTLPQAARTQLARLRPERIYVLGGTASVSAEVAAQAAEHLAIGGSLRRLSGADRFATAISVSRALSATGSADVTIASGTGFPDALAAAARGKPLLLNPVDPLLPAVGVEIDRIEPDTTFVVGGPSVIGDRVMAQLSASPTTGADTVSMFSDPGDYIGQGEELVFIEGDAEISWVGNAEGASITVSGGSPDRAYTIDVVGASGGNLQPGRHEVRRAIAPPEGYAGLDVYGEGRGCNTLEGFIDIRHIALDPNGNLSALWFTYDQHCEGGHQALFGEVRIGMANQNPVLMAPSAVQWPATYPGVASRDARVTIKNTSSEPLAVDDVSLSGPDGPSFVLVDPCTGRQLEPASTCDIRVRHLPADAGSHDAQVTVTTSRGESTTSLRGIAIGGRTRAVLDSELDEFVAQRDYEFSPRTAVFDAIGGGHRVMISFVENDGTLWHAIFSAPLNETLKVGVRYDGATRSSGQTAGLSVTGDNRGCNEVHGSFEVTHATYGRDGGVLSFGATFEQYCDSNAGPLRGVIEFRVPDGTGG